MELREFFLGDIGVLLHDTGHSCTRMCEAGIPVRTGRFAARMAVRLVNDGPVTIWMDTRDR